MHIPLLHAFVSSYSINVIQFNMLKRLSADETLAFNVHMYGPRTSYRLMN